MSENKPEAETLTASRLREVLRYDPETGRFSWKLQRGRQKAGSDAGWKGGDRYVQIGISGRLYYAHRLAWLYETGNWPTDQLDHINGDPSDNRIANLRECTNSENGQNLGRKRNNTTGATGVVWDKSRNKWRAQIRENGKVRGIGRFNLFEEAVAAHAEAKKNAHSFQPTLRSN